MARLKVSLSIGYPTAQHKDIIDIDDEELSECETEEQRNDLMYEYWRDWSYNYIDGGYELVD